MRVLAIFLYVFFCFNFSSNLCMDTGSSFFESSDEMVELDLDDLDDVKERLKKEPGLPFTLIEFEDITAPLIYLPMQTGRFKDLFILLLEYVDINKKTSDGKTLLDVAFEKIPATGDGYFVLSLLAHGAQFRHAAQMIQYADLFNEKERLIIMGDISSFQNLDLSYLGVIDYCNFLYLAAGMGRKDFFEHILNQIPPESALERCIRSALVFARSLIENGNAANIEVYRRIQELLILRLATMLIKGGQVAKLEKLVSTDSFYENISINGENVLDMILKEPAVAGAKILGALLAYGCVLSEQNLDIIRERNLLPPNMMHVVENKIDELRAARLESAYSILPLLKLAAGMGRKEIVEFLLTRLRNYLPCNISNITDMLRIVVTKNQSAHMDEAIAQNYRKILEMLKNFYAVPLQQSESYEDRCARELQQFPLFVPLYSRNKRLAELVSKGSNM